MTVPKKYSTYLRESSPKLAYRLLNAPSYGLSFQMWICVLEKLSIFYTGDFVYCQVLLTSCETEITLNAVLAFYKIVYFILRQGNGFTVHSNEWFCIFGYFRADMNAVQCWKI